MNIPVLKGMNTVKGELANTIAVKQLQARELNYGNTYQSALQEARDTSRVLASDGTRSVVDRGTMAARDSSGPQRADMNDGEQSFRWPSPPPIIKMNDGTQQRTDLRASTQRFVRKNWSETNWMASDRYLPPRK